jgi:hypothetical protein
VRVNISPAVEAFMICASLPLPMISIARLVFRFLKVKSALNRFASGTSPGVLRSVASRTLYSSSEADSAAGEGILFLSQTLYYYKRAVTKLDVVCCVLFVNQVFSASTSVCP